MTKARRKQGKEDLPYLNFIRQNPCVICGSYNVIAHHKTGAGMGMKAPDSETLPLCENHHTGKDGIHTIGVKTWERRFRPQQEYIDRMRAKWLSRIYAGG